MTSAAANRSIERAASVAKIRDIRELRVEG
jgi:hypothetical protein